LDHQGSENSERVLCNLGNLSCFQGLSYVSFETFLYNTRHGEATIQKVVWQVPKPSFSLLGYTPPLMENYTLIDAAVESIENYMTSLDVGESEINILLRPSFNTEGETTQVEYTVELEDTEAEFEHTFQMDQDFHELDAEKIAPQHHYSRWVERFIKEFPRSDLDYRPVGLTRPEIDEAAGVVRNFLDMTYLDEDEVGMVFDVSENLGRWSIEYSIRSFPGADQKAGLDWTMEFEDTSYDEFRNEIYPLWIRKFEEEFNSELSYPEPEELDEIME